MEIKKKINKIKHVLECECPSRGAATYIRSLALVHDMWGQSSSEERRPPVAEAEACSISANWCVQGRAGLAGNVTIKQIFFKDIHSCLSFSCTAANHKLRCLYLFWLCFIVVPTLLTLPQSFCTRAHTHTHVLFIFLFLNSFIFFLVCVVLLFVF